MTEPTKIRTLAAMKRAPDADIVALLEAALERARKGELDDCLLIYSTAAEYDFDYKLNSDGFGIAGYMVRVQHYLAAERDE